MQVFKFKTLDEAIERSNATNYGLASGIITKDINTALTYSQGVRAGSVWSVAKITVSELLCHIKANNSLFSYHFTFFLRVNTYFVLSPQLPFGGFKESGHGRAL